MTQQPCNAPLSGSNHMANSIKTNITQPIGDKYIKTFDACDDPIVYTLVRVSPYTMEDMLLGVFDSKEAVLCRLARIMDRPANDEQFKIETHNLRTLKQEEDLN